MKRLIPLLILPLILLACEFPTTPQEQTQTATFATPKPPTATAKATLQHGAATQTAIATQSEYVPEDQECTWRFDAGERFGGDDYAVVPLYDFPFSGSEWSNVLVAGDTITLTGRTVAHTGTDDVFVEVWRVNEVAVQPFLWARFIQIYADDRSAERLPERRWLFSKTDDCDPDSATPTPEAPDATATPVVGTSDFDAYLLLSWVTALRVRERVNGQCSMAGAIHSTIGYPRGLALRREHALSVDPASQVTFEMAEVVNGNLAGLCVAIQTAGGGTVYMERVS